MKDYTSEFIRNVAVAGHGKTGKTSLLDACLFHSGAVKRIGKVDNGTSVLDYEAEETKRKMTISDSLAVTEWKDHKINFIDAPGYPDFIGEVMGAMAAADTALIIVAANAGVEVETEKAWALAESLNLPRALFINKMDREHADFRKTLDDIRAKFGNSCVPVQIPIGKETSFKGVVDLINSGDVPADLADEVDTERLEMLDIIAEFNDELMEKYLEGETDNLDEKQIAAALAEGVKQAKVFPVFVGSALQNIGVDKLLDNVVNYLPAPNFRDKVGTNPANGDLVERKISDAFSGQIWKTMVDPFVGRMSYIRVFSGDMKASGEYQLIGENSEGTERINGLFTMQGKTQINLDVAHAGDIVITAKLSNAKTCDTLCEKGAAIKYERVNYPEPMLAMAVSSVKKGEEDKVIGAITRQMDEDQTLQPVKQFLAASAKFILTFWAIKFNVNSAFKWYSANLELTTAKLSENLLKYKASTKNNPADTDNTAMFGLKLVQIKTAI